VHLHQVCKPLHSMREHPTCPRCGQPVMVAEIEDPDSNIITPLEQEIVCPQCGGFISALMSLKRVVTYQAPIGEYADEIEAEIQENVIASRSEFVHPLT